MGCTWWVTVFESMFVQLIRGSINFYLVNRWYFHCQVMQKVFALLLAEFRKLGATIVFASFSRIIIDTGKSDLSAAKAYCDSVLKTLQTRFVSTCILVTCYLYASMFVGGKWLGWPVAYFDPLLCGLFSWVVHVISNFLYSRDLFEWIELEPFQFWHSLLFMDQVNNPS